MFYLEVSNEHLFLWLSNDIKTIVVNHPYRVMSKNAYAVAITPLSPISDFENFENCLKFPKFSTFFLQNFHSKNQTVQKTVQYVRGQWLINMCTKFQDDIFKNG